MPQINIQARAAFRTAYAVLRACGSFEAARRNLERNGRSDAAIFLPAAAAAFNVRTERVVA